MRSSRRYYLLVIGSVITAALVTSSLTYYLVTSLGLGRVTSTVTYSVTATVLKTLTKYEVITKTYTTTPVKYITLPPSVTTVTKYITATEAPKHRKYIRTSKEFRMRTYDIVRLGLEDAVLTSLITCVIKSLRSNNPSSIFKDPAELLTSLITMKLASVSIVALPFLPRWSFPSF